MTFDKRLDAIFAWASGDEFCELPEFNVFLKSIVRIRETSFEGARFNGDVLIFTHDMSSQVRLKMKFYGFDVIDVDPTEIHMVVRDRFLSMYKWMAKHTKQYRRVLLVDSKDVVFQGNPFAFLDIHRFASRDDLVALCMEGGEHYQSEWNAMNQVKYQMNVKEFEINFSKWPIINSGFIIGSYEEMKNLCLLIWSNTLSTLAPISEQATLNYLVTYLLLNKTYKLISPIEYNLCITGESVVRNWLVNETDLGFKLKDGKIYNSALGLPYCAFHQWERTYLKDSILEQYEES